MDIDLVKRTQEALKQINEVEEELKHQGLDSLADILKQKSQQLVNLGYDLLIFKELIKIIEFDNDYSLEKAMDLLQDNYFDDKKHHDEMAEKLMYRVGRSTNFGSSKILLEKLAILVDKFDDSIAKHSKQILRLADVNDMPSLNPLVMRILEAMKEKLPRRMSNLDEG